ncbi:PREDICTED: uncharacterized protein LOC105455539 [Wasmannia auropunctata]|uniref:uncharacterized protein LOC105455539 n=1 Tax=Wasmannia auropunctata TaxID=64793 RepID=UPI0005EE8E3E|nr:PREDICTED: uncharacterized protein LOC105455539 [Wasmannia auropunctata]XP_011697234.1 PREDICTED: uncharacterized protein LOC105455539 [Wasmannia auropunctata]XP_011697235.1 PREDICTED: uncharacterized protein LOC105455539 [Wasmannia auropunctata]
MDDVNIHEICFGLDEQSDEDEEDWIKLSWINSQSVDKENFQSPQRDSDNEIAQTKDYDDKVPFTNAEPEDISDGISVITESDIDAVNTNLQICQFVDRKPCRQMLERSIWNILIACVLGIIIGLVLSHLFTIPETHPVSNAESLETASRNIVNTCKELTDVKTMLNEIKTHMPTDRKITEQLFAQFSEISDFSKANGKPIVVTKEFFNSTPRPLDQLQASLRVLSSLAVIYDDNNLKNEINKTLDIVNSTEAFYDTLALFTNSTQDEYKPVVLNFLQHSNDKMHTTSKLLLSDLAEKVSKITSKVYNKYAKDGHKLNKKLCHLKSILPDDKLLKQLTENNQLLKDYDKSCFSNDTKDLNDRTTAKGNTKIKNTKYVRETDDKVLHAKYDKKNTHKIHDNNKENSSKDKKNKQNVEKSIPMKILQNAGRKIHNTSQLLISKVVENTIKLRQELNKKLQHLKDILPNSGEFLKQLMEDDEGDNKGSKYEGKNDDSQSNVIQKNSFDNILMPLKHTCPLSTDYCPKFNINTSAFDTVPNHKTKNYKHKKHDANSKKTVMDYENSAKTLPAEGKGGSTKKDCFKSNEPTKKIVNDKANYEENDISSQNKIKDYKSEHTVNYRKSKHPSFDSRAMKQDNQHYTNTDKRSDSKRYYEYREYRKQRQLDDSDWYFRRVHARRNARRHAEYIYH